MKLRKKRILTAYLFLAIPMVFFMVVRFWPMLYSFWMSFTDWNLLSTAPKNFVGLANYQYIFGNEAFVKSLFNTFAYVLIGVPLTIILSLFIAILLNRIIRAQGLFRLLYLMPFITPVVAVSWVWRWIYQPVPTGILNNLLVAIGLDAQGFINSPTQALVSIVITTVWMNLGYCIVIFLAGLQTIPQDLIEAAKIDGANRRQSAMKITIPLLNPIILFMVVMQSISFLRIFTQVYNMSSQGTGGPLNSTKTIVLFIYQKAFVDYDMGIASSASVILFAMIMIITFLQFKFVRRDTGY